jgi:hypothetical protein
MFHFAGMEGEIKITNIGCPLLEYTVDIFNGFISKL